eukprot:10309-Heterococcus_DN1.PRE.1
MSGPQIPTCERSAAQCSSVMMRCRTHTCACVTAALLLCLATQRLCELNTANAVARPAIASNSYVPLSVLLHFAAVHRYNGKADGTAPYLDSAITGWNKRCKKCEAHMYAIAVRQSLHHVKDSLELCSEWLIAYNSYCHTVACITERLLLSTATDCIDRLCEVALIYLMYSCLVTFTLLTCTVTSMTRTAHATVVTVHHRSAQSQ